MVFDRRFLKRRADEKGGGQSRGGSRGGRREERGRKGKGRSSSLPSLLVRDLHLLEKRDRLVCRLRTCSKIIPIPPQKSITRVSEGEEAKRKEGRKEGENEARELSPFLCLCALEGRNARGDAPYPGTEF